MFHKIFKILGWLRQNSVTLIVTNQDKVGQLRKEYYETLTISAANFGKILLLHPSGDILSRDINKHVRFSELRKL